MKTRSALLALTLLGLALLIACGGGGGATTSGGPTPTPTPTASPTASPTPGPVPQFNHIAVVVLENAGYSDVIGNPVMPYLNSLATSSSLAASYYANFHPSIGNYFMLTTGTQVTNDDSFNGTVSVDNLVREMNAAGVSWKSYQEDLPSAGYLGGNTGNYLKRHNPFAFFSDVTGAPAQAAKIVPYTQLAADSSATQLPQFLFIIPNSKHDAHDCPIGMTTCTIDDKLSAADQWLQGNISTLLADGNFSNNGLLIIVFDEAQDSDTTNGGGRVACVLVGAHVKPGYTSATLFQHQDLLRLIAEGLHLTTIPGSGATAKTMGEFFQ